MSARRNREGAPSGASDPVPALIATFREIGARMEAWDFVDTPEARAGYQALEDASSATLTAIEMTQPTTGEGLAASLRFYRELRDNMFSVDDVTWLETLAKAAHTL